MDIQQTIAPAVAKPQATDKPEKAKDVLDGQVSAPDFSQLLQGLQDVPVELPEGLASLQPELPDIPQALLEATFAQPELEALPVGLSVESLVGQTQRLDVTDADAAVQDGSFLLARQESGLTAARGALFAGTQPHVAIGQQIATVAAGVQSVATSSLLPEANAAVAAASALVAEAADAADTVAQAVSSALQSDQDGEGRVALHGAWKLEDPQVAANPALQRLMGQVEQWAAATAGVQAKPSERLEGSKNAAGAADVLAVGQGSGTRLTDVAVQEAKSTQDAVLDTAPEAPVEDMRFWLQGKQQRAEVVLEKDGQPVRVQVSVRGNEAHVTFRADQAQTRDLLDASLTQLREMLAQQGVELAGVAVQADAQGNTSSSGGGQRNPWEAAPMRQAQVTVPVADALPVRPQRNQGLDLYA